MNNNIRNVFFGPQVIQNKNWLILSHKKKVSSHFDSNFVSCSYEGEFRVYFNFFHLNVLVSNFYFRSNKLTQINHVIVNIFSGILVVTANI